jgi:ubiquinone/menaquinone biosynthesis C-methylase UbiE
MPPDIHSAASKGYSLEASRYERGRPEYPTELSSWLTSTLGLGPNKRAVDVGAGTGKFTRLLLATRASVVGVEPIEAMRHELARLPNVEVLSGTAQHLPLPDASADAIVCAQAFHWFAQSEVLDEFARVLKPGGRLGLVWNVRDESFDWVKRITDIITPFEGDAPRFYKGDWKKPFPHPAFTALQETAFKYEHEGTPEEVIIDRFMSVSFLAVLPPDEKAGVRSELEDLIASHPELAGQGVVKFPYKTVAFHCRRK